jgi:hypothetical protein
MSFKEEFLTLCKAYSVCVNVRTKSSGLYIDLTPSNDSTLSLYLDLDDETDGFPQVTDLRIY